MDEAPDLEFPPRVAGRVIGPIPSPSLAIIFKEHFNGTPRERTCQELFSLIGLYPGWKDFVFQRDRPF